MRIETLKRRKSLLCEVLLGEKTIVVEINDLDELRELSQLVLSCTVKLTPLIRKLAEAEIGEAAEFLRLLSRFHVTYDLPVKTKTALWEMLRRVLQAGYEVSPRSSPQCLYCSTLQ